MQVHCNGEDERPDRTWLGGLGKLACLESVRSVDLGIPRHASGR